MFSKNVAGSANGVSANPQLQRIYALLRETTASSRTRWYSSSDIATRCGVSAAFVARRINDLRSPQYGGFEILCKRTPKGAAYQLVLASVTPEKEEQLRAGRGKGGGGFKKPLDRRSILYSLRLLEKAIVDGADPQLVQMSRIGLLDALRERGYLDPVYVPPLVEITPEAQRRARLQLLDALVVQGALASEDLIAWLKRKQLVKRKQLGGDLNGKPAGW